MALIEMRVLVRDLRVGDQLRLEGVPDSGTPSSTSPKADRITEQANKADPVAQMRRDADEMANTYRTRRPAFKPLGSRLARARRQR